MMKSNWIRVGMLLASGATMMGWGCTDLWAGWWGMAAGATVGLLLGSYYMPNA